MLLAASTYTILKFERCVSETSIDLNTPCTDPCTGPETIVAYGIDPVFKSGTVSYNGDLDDANGTIVLGYYNCSVLTGATYSVPFLNTTVNAKPYCAELYNPQNLPYAFHYFPLASKDPGFPVWFDINLGAVSMV